ncbi:MAG: class I SAM-dependent methyltransferase [Proteobacteria bacterium]|nr:class I SAM-dependent methyltransferase [Pseudomonadota bacterium]
MTYSNVLKRELPNQRVSTFLAYATYSQLRDAASGLLRHGRLRRVERTVERVRSGYDDGRSKIEIGSFDDFVIGNWPSDFAYVDGRLQFTDPNRATHARMQGMLERVRRYAGDGAVVEIGCGTGRNLLYLARHGVTNPLVGLELSPVSVDLARRAAESFGHAIRYEECDITRTLPEIGPVDVVLSVHAFEMMPRVFVEGLVNIATLRPKAAVFLEPIEELWPGMSLSCMLARLRVRRLDRLSGFHKHAAALGKVVEARFLGDAINPLNPTSVMVVEFGERRS